jgi:NADH:ubiquinone oxidoreductase subunit F (NADH-binding)/NADH:ubiquinone oxidoreductase subunit E
MVVETAARANGRPAARGVGRGRRTPKGRQSAPMATAEVKALLGDRPRRPDLLIEHLHLIQDRHHHLSAAHLKALADELRLAEAEVFEVASFYAHFDVVREGKAPPPALTVRVCDSLTCSMLGAEALIEALEAGVDPTAVRVVRAPCMGACDRAPTIEIAHRQLHRTSPGEALAAVEAGRVHPDLPDYIDLARYRASGGYALLERLRLTDPGDAASGRVHDFLERLEASGLRGLGGAGFPTARKWQLVMGRPGPRQLCVNADEGEPGTFKDRHYLETDPHRFLEGMLIASWSIDAANAWIYLRDEYPAIRAILIGEIAALEAAGLAAPGHIQLRRGAGAYICGEESAMIESIEGKRGLPRHRPPYVAEVGLFGQPTLVNNVETLYWVRDIVERGPEWFAGHGRNGSKGLRSYSVSGRVKLPGVKLAPAGITARALIDEFAGGMAEGHAFRAYLPGGASGGILPAAMADIPLDFGKLEHLGCFVGSHAVVILSDQDDLKAAALNLLRFFKDESCGQCTPCRSGTEKAVALMQRPVWDRPLLLELADAMAEASICGLGQAAGNPIKCLIRYFPELFDG